MYKMGTYVIFVVDRCRRLRCPLVCTEVQTNNRSERTANKLWQQWSAEGMATVCGCERNSTNTPSHVHPRRQERKFPE